MNLNFVHQNPFICWFRSN